MAMAPEIQRIQRLELQLLQADARIRELEFALATKGK